MPKYRISEERLDRKENFLQCIANELAEANRLKIIELRDQGCDQEELKDRA